MPKKIPAPEGAPAVVLGAQPGGVTSVAVTPTQVRRPWRSTARTAFQALVGLCVLAPVLVNELGVDVDQLPWLVAPLAVAATVTRVMAIPGVEQWLRRFAPFLAAAPGPTASLDPSEHQD